MKNVSLFFSPPSIKTNFLVEFLGLKPSGKRKKVGEWGQDDAFWESFPYSIHSMVKYEKMSTQFKNTS